MPQNVIVFGFQNQSYGYHVGIHGGEIGDWDDGTNIYILLYSLDDSQEPTV